MKLLSYYIYAIRGIWMDRYKIGYYIGDLKTLKKRYSTYYGAQLELYIFEINCDKLMAQGIERNIFKRMKTYKCGIGELYYATCLDTFLQLGLKYCNNNVTIPLKKGKKNKDKNDNNSNMLKIVNPTPINNFDKNFENINHIIREHYDDVVYIEEKITNKDILPCLNGNINLKNGELIENTNIYKKINIEYPGIDYNTDYIENFMLLIFNENKEVVEYVQRLLGYGITGQNIEQCFIIFYGEGSNGKSLLISIIENLLEYYCVRADDEVFFNYRKIKNGPSSHIAALRDKRICIKEETNLTRDLNIETLKEITGNNKIKGRNHYQKYSIEFEPTVLPILSCNQKPHIDVYDISIARRVILIPFDIIFVGENDYKIPFNHNNKMYRLKDLNLKNTLFEPEIQKQLLVWLVKGSINWYQNGLLGTPDLICHAFKKYYDESDYLTSFVKEFCVCGKEEKISVSLFKDTLKKNTRFKIVINNDRLFKLMKEKGFNIKQIVGIKHFIGLNLNEFVKPGNSVGIIS